MAEDKETMPIKESAPEISVILPVYNVEDYIDVCMESIIRQTYRNMEILLINDGSTDASAEKCAAWRDRDPRAKACASRASTRPLWPMRTASSR